MKNRKNSMKPAVLCSMKFENPDVARMNGRSVYRYVNLSYALHQAISFEYFC